MLNLEEVIQRKKPRMLAEMQRRIPRQLQTLGPRAVNSPMLFKQYLWSGEVKGEFTYNESDSAVNAYLEFTNPQGAVTVFNRFTSAAERSRFALCFDVNGRETIVWQEGNTSHIFFYDDSKTEWINLPLEVGARSPVTALDSLLPNKELRDVVVSYLLGTKLMVRYQRERFATAHEVPGVDVRPTDMLRTCGFTSEGRFSWRFENKVPVDIAGGRT